MKRSNGIRANTVAQAAPLVVGYGLNIVVTPLVVHRLGLRDFGIWAMTGALAQYGAIFDLGVTRSVMRYVAFYSARSDVQAEREVVGTAAGVLAIVAAALFALTYASAPAILELIPARDIAELRTLLMAAVTILISVLAAKVLVAAAFGRGRMVAGNAALAAQSGLTVLAGAAVLLAEDATLSRFAVATAGGAAFGVLLAAVTMKLSEGSLSLAVPSRDRAREVLSFGIKNQATLVADLVVFQSDKLVIGAVAGPAFAGAYELANRLALGLRALGGMVSNAMTPSLTVAYSERGLDGVLAVYAAVTRKATAVAILFPLLGIAVAAAAIPAWLGHTPPYTVAILSALCAAFAANLSTGVATVVSAAIGRPGITARSAFFSAAANAVLLVPGAWLFGVGGVVGSTVIASIGGACFGIWITHRALGVPMSVYWDAVKGVLALGVACAAGTSVILHALPLTSRVEAFAWLVLGSGLFLASYTYVGLKRGFLPAIRQRQVPQPVGEMP